VGRGDIEDRQRSNSELNRPLPRNRMIVVVSHTHWDREWTLLFAGARFQT